MSEPSASQYVVCPACGSECLSTSPACWLCRSDLSSALPIITATVVAQPAADKSIGQHFLGWLTIACVCFALLVGIGILQSEPSMIAPYLILTVPAFIATGGRAAWARAQGKNLSGSQLFLTFAGSIALIVGLMSLLVVCAIVALIIACFSMGPMNFH